MMSGRGPGPEGMMGGMRMIEGRGGRGVASIRVRGPRTMGGLRGAEALSGIAPRHRFRSQFKLIAPSLSWFFGFSCVHGSFSLLSSWFEIVIVVLSVGFYPTNSTFIQYMHILK